MLSKKNKLPREQFDVLLKQKQKKITTPCGVFSYKEGILEGFHVSVVVSKKVAKKAHERNYIKRVLYTYFSIYTHIPFFGYLLVSKEGYSLLLSDKQKIEHIFHGFFENYSKK